VAQVKPGCKLGVRGSTCNVDPRGCMDCKADAGPVTQSFIAANAAALEAALWRARRDDSFPDRPSRGRKRR